MKLNLKKYIPHTLAFMLIASSPLSVLSTTAYANSLEEAIQEQVVQPEPILQEELNSQPEAPVLVPMEQSPTESEPPESDVNDSTETPSETTEPPSSEVEEPLTPPATPPPTDVVEEEPSEQPTEEVVEEEIVEEEQPIEEVEQPVEEPSTFDSRFEKAKETMLDQRTYELQVELVEEAIASFKKEQTVENLQLVADYVVLLPYDNSQNEYKDDKFNYNNLMPNLFEFLANGKEKNELLFHFADKSIDQTLETLNHNDLRIAITAHNLLPEGKMKEDNKKRIEDAYYKVYEKNSKPETRYINWDDPTIKYDDDIQTPDPGNWEPDFDPGDYVEPTPTVPPVDDLVEGYAVINYSLENGTCYKTSTYYSVDGNFIRQAKDVASESEKVFCTVDIPLPNAKDYYNDNWNKDLLENVDGSPDGEISPDELNGSDTQANLSSDTIQYTFEKNSDSPYYYDTGIYVSKEGTITYQQARDALYQIAIQAKGKFVEDKDRALALLDGRIILVEDKGKEIQIQDFLSLFDETSIGVKAQETRSGDSYSLVDLVEIKTVSSVSVNGNDVNLEANPIVDDGTVLFPLENIAKSLKGTVSKTDESTTVEFEGNRITFADNQLSANENGKEKILSVATRQNQDGIRMVEAKAVLDFFHSTLEIDSQSNQVIITTN